MNNRIDLETGSLSEEELRGILKVLPVEITFISEDDVIRFYTTEDDPIFSREPDNIGIDVRKCHAESSHAEIDKMIDEFRSGKSSVAEGWIKHKGKLVHLRYFAVRDSNGKYLGVLEFVQDVSRIRKLRGEQKGLRYY